VAKANVSVVIKGEDRLSGVFKRVGASFDRFATRLTTAFKRVTAVGAVAVAGAAATATILTKKSMELMDVTGKLADRLGETTEAITSLQHASELSGVSSDSMNTALDKMSRNLGLAAIGSGDAGKALDALGLSVDSLIKIRPTEAFAEIADALNRIGDQSVKAAITTKIFGRSGIELLNVLALGKKGLAANADEARRLGLTYSRQAALGVEEANDALYKLRQTLTAIGNKLAIAVSPAITNIVDRILEASYAAGGIGKIIEAGISKAIAAIGRLIDVFHFLKGAALNTIAAIQEKLKDFFWDLARFLRTASRSRVPGLLGIPTRDIKSLSVASAWTGEGFRIGARDSRASADRAFGRFNAGTGAQMSEAWNRKFLELSRSVSRSQRAPVLTGWFKQLGDFQRDLVRRGASVPGRLTQMLQPFARTPTPTMFRAGSGDLSPVISNTLRGAPGASATDLVKRQVKIADDQKTLLKKQLDIQTRTLRRIDLLQKRADQFPTGSLAFGI
jgi:hypothetical protein